MTTFEELWERQAAFSERTFDVTPLAVLKHLRKEVEEAIADPGDEMEFADLLLLIVDYARRSGMTCAHALNVAMRKLAVNEGRTWPNRGSVDRNESIEHDRAEANRAHLPAVDVPSDGEGEPLSCPFCGSHAKAWGTDDVPTKVLLSRVACTRCGAMTGNFHKRSEAITAWNTRSKTR